jgi:hypothetical protein
VVTAQEQNNGNIGWLFTNAMAAEVLISNCPWLFISQCALDL